MDTHRPDITPLMAACRAGDQDLVNILIEQTEDINLGNRNGTTAFMYAKTAALGSGDLTILMALIQAGANPNAKDKFNKTALDYAKENSKRVLSFLEEVSQ